jgi:integrase
VAEVVGAEIEHITQKDGHPVLPIAGKGRRKRELPLPPLVYSRITAYLATRGDVDLLPAVAAGGRTQNRPLFATRYGRRLDPGQVRRDLKRLARKAGGDLAEVVDCLTPHALRHSWVSDLLAEGVPLRDVQYGAGHQNPTTTERYDHAKMDPDQHPAYARAAQVARGYRLKRQGGEPA